VTALQEQYKVLVKEKLADSGVDLLRQRFDVDLGVDWSDEELEQRIGDYHAILIRSATRLTADLIARAENLKVIVRAGIGVDNVDVEAATKRGIIVANAPQSNIVAAAEHTVALMLSLARNIPQAHGSLTSGKWERSNVVTAVELPDSIDGGKVPGALRKLGITANGGQNQLKGKIIRIAHCGYFGAFDILTSLSGLEMVLDQLGHEVEHGAGVGAAQRVFLQAGVPVAAA